MRVLAPQSVPEPLLLVKLLLQDGPVDVVAQHDGIQGDRVGDVLVGDGRTRVEPEVGEAIGGGIDEIGRPGRVGDQVAIGVREGAALFFGTDGRRINPVKPVRKEEAVYGT